MKLFLFLFLFSNSTAFSFFKNNKKYLQLKETKLLQKKSLFYLFFTCILFCSIVYGLLILANKYREYKEKQEKIKEEQKKIKKFINHAEFLLNSIVDLFKKNIDYKGSLKIEKILEDLTSLKDCVCSKFLNYPRSTKYCVCLLEYLIENSCPSKNPNYISEFAFIFKNLKKFKRLANEVGELKDCKCGNIYGSLSKYLAKSKHEQEKERKAVVESYKEWMFLFF